MSMSVSHFSISQCQRRFVIFPGRFWRWLLWGPWMGVWGQQRGERLFVLKLDLQSCGFNCVCCDGQSLGHRPGGRSVWDSFNVWFHLTRNHPSTLLFRGRPAGPLFAASIIPWSREKRAAGPEVVAVSWEGGGGGLLRALPFIWKSQCVLGWVQQGGCLESQLCSTAFRRSCQGLWIPGGSWVHKDACYFIFNSNSKFKPTLKSLEQNCQHVQCKESTHLAHRLSTPQGSLRSQWIQAVEVKPRKIFLGHLPVTKHCQNMDCIGEKKAVGRNTINWLFLSVFASSVPQCVGFLLNMKFDRTSTI